jgi:hypothetical protein
MWRAKGAESCAMKPNILSLVLFALLTYFAPTLGVRAVAPPPDGDYPRGNTAEGHNALFSLTTGPFNTANGYEALRANTTGEANTANGARALASNTIGHDNTANGFQALYLNTTGNYNIAIGSDALHDNITGRGNTAIGYQALSNNTGASWNTANGFQALFKNTTGDLNTAIGGEALFSNTTGDRNTVLGFQALRQNTTGDLNTAIGEVALQQNTIGSSNSAFGEHALYLNTTGTFNIALGVGAGRNLTTGSHNIDIGNVGVAGESDTIRIGNANQTNTYITGISGATVAGGVTVIVDAQGHLGTMISSERFKDQIKGMDKASEAIFALKPVTFRYKHKLDPEGIPQFGLVAEEVEKVNPDLIARDEQGKPYSVRYEAVNAMLLNEFLKEHREVQELKKQVAALTAGLQKVSAQVELNKLAPQTVKNDD